MWLVYTRNIKCLNDTERKRKENEGMGDRMEIETKRMREIEKKVKER